MSKCDFHVHSLFSDGSDTIEDIIKSAIAKGMDKIGLSDHSYTFFDESYCISRDNIPRYIEKIHTLKEKYKDDIEVFCGIEQDFYSDESTDRFDYSIGSVHYILINGKYFPVDENTDMLKDFVNTCFGGDYYSLCELYFDTVSQVIEKTDCDIIGHFDLITRFNKDGCLFDENSERYINAWKAAVDRLIKFNRPFEINTSPLYRKYKYDVYPSRNIREYIKQKGGSFILSSDSHKKEDLCSMFELFSDLKLKEIPV